MSRRCKLDMFVHKFVYNDTPLFTFLDKSERVVQYPTNYLRTLTHLNRPLTSRNHIAEVLKLFCQWIETSPFFCGIDIDHAIESVTRDDILEWIVFQRKNVVSEITINNREVILKDFFEWLTTGTAGRIINAIPWETKNFTKAPHKRLPRFVTSKQLITLLNGLYSESQRVALHFLYDTGLRISELIRIPASYLPNEVDWQNNLLYYPLLVNGSKARDGNQYKYRYTVISRPMLARIRRYHSTYRYALAKHWKINAESKPMFLNVYGKSLSVSGVQKMISTALERQGRDKSEITAQKLRHGTAFSILRSEFGKDFLERFLLVKSSFGHNSIKTTEIYSSIPITILNNLSRGQKPIYKYEEAQEIYDQTYLPEHLNKERRGYKNGR